MSELEELEELIYLLENFREAHCNQGLENYQVHLDTTVHLVETRRLALLRNAKQERLKLLDNERAMVVKSTGTGPSQSMRLVDPYMGHHSESISQQNRSLSDRELYIVQ